jgi:transcriptional regulator with XRE-family HTH domain
MTYVSPGELLKRIRIRCGITLRQFCLDQGLDARRFSMIERDVLSPTEDEVDKYMGLIKLKAPRGD